ncbi:glutathione S-transferase family protein [Tropicibacter sp. Alg240-R139]|uniref:glutathione S-transferase family protein n=1 Tax=Tropicibacter sp. Alg240-R139 TaxID=2305991 RepID=UPI0013E036C8|nr:glutathione S-transferase family protein [Tropicibacter sp. Alg240-R139]
MVTLYHYAGATCATKTLLTLYEKGVAFDEEIVTPQRLDSEEYRRLNPDGVVPTLVDGGTVLNESSVIMVYIDEAFEGPVLTPQSPALRARMNWWLKTVDSAFDALRVFSFAIFVRDKLASLAPDVLEKKLQQIPYYAWREERRRLVADGPYAEDALPAIQQIVALQAKAERALQDQAYLVGDYTLADAALTPFINRFERLGVMLNADQAPNLAEWWSRMKERPSYSAAIADRTTQASLDAAKAGRERFEDRINELLEHKECQRALRDFQSPE